MLAVHALQQGEWADYEGAHLFSPTGIDEFSACQRKWAFKKIEKVRVPQNASAFLGSSTHSLLEKFVDEGRRLDFVSDGEAAHVASSAMHLVEAFRAIRIAMPSSISLEREFRFRSEKTGFIYHGIKDVEVEPGVPITALQVAGDAPVVSDYKTTSNIDEYAKQPGDLLWDVQSNVYAIDAMARWRKDVADLRWIYMQTKKTRKSFVSAVRITSEQSAVVFEAIEGTAAQMSRALDDGKRPLELAPNTNACSAFGGCPYGPQGLNLCNLTSSQKARARVSNTSSLIADLRKRVQGAQAPAVEEKKEEQKPAVMGCADTDVPPATEIPACLTQETPAAAASSSPVRINPPEGDLPPPPAMQAAPATSADEKPKTTRTRRTTKKDTPDPKGADAAMHTGIDVAQSNGSDKAQASGVVESMQKELEDTIKATTVDTAAGFTLYVDCLPLGRAPRTFSTFIEKAQTKILETQGVGDYRLIDFGKGAPLFIGFVAQEIAGFQGELFLDTRTPEGAVLLETVSGMAANVVRGIR